MQAELAFGQGVVFFRLRPRKIVYSSFSFCNSFPREACNNLAQPMKVNTLERALVEAFSNRFPSRATAHQCTRMSVSVSSQSGGSNQELDTQAVWCVAQELVMRLLSALLNDYHLDVSQGGKRLVGTLVIVTDPFQKSAEDRMLGHPTRDSFDVVETTCWFLHDVSDRNMTTLC